MNLENREQWKSIGVEIFDDLHGRITKDGADDALHGQLPGMASGYEVEYDESGLRGEWFSGEIIEGHHYNLYIG